MARRAAAMLVLLACVPAAWARADKARVDVQVVYPGESPTSPLRPGLDIIEQKFIEPIPRDQLEAQALALLLEKLDPYAHYLSPAEVRAFQEDNQASFGGIGVALGDKHPSGYPWVEFLLHGGAAVAAGVQRGDLLLEVDGRDLKGLGEEAVSGALRGKVDTPMKLLLRRAGTEAPIALELRRVAIAMPTVRAIRRDASGGPDWWLDRERRIGYLRISHLSLDTVAGVDGAVAGLQAGGARGLVLDLRDCSGGMMNAALGTADLFVRRGRLLTVRERGKDETYEAKPGKYTKLPMVLLINGGTVSSGEILAGAIADNGRATTVGERTFGKGRVQVVYSLGEQRGAVMLSTGSFQRPNGKTIDKHDLPEGSKEPAGIAPDIEVKMSEAERAAWLDFAEKTTGPLILTPEEQQGAPPDPQLAKALELLQEK